MAWSVGKVQNINFGPGSPSYPGFTIQQVGRSPSLSFMFGDNKTAQECAALMQKIVDRSVEIRGRD
jgi:hypothetical protein